MLNMRRILRDYQDAGSVNSLLAPWGFVDDHTFLTKAGHVGVVYRVASPRLPSNVLRAPSPRARGRIAPQAAHCDG
jgi:hypothetical protein